MIVKASSTKELISELNKRFKNTEWEIEDDCFVYVIDKTDNYSVNYYSYNFNGKDCYTLKHQF